MDAAELLGLNRAIADPLTHVRDITPLPNDNGIRLEGTTASDRRVELTVEALQGDVLRIRFGLAAPDRRAVGSAAASQPQTLKPLDLIDENTSAHQMGAHADAPRAETPTNGDPSARTTLVSGPLRAVVSREPFRLEIEEDATGRTLLRTSTTDIDVMLRPRVSGFGFRPQRDALLTTMGLELTSDERFAGLGEQFGPLNLRGQRVQLLNLDAMGVGRDAAYKNVPFVMSSRGYGLFWNTFARMQHDIGYPQTSLYSYAVESEESELDLWFLYGPSPSKIIERYTALTGRSPVPPAWSFGLWMSRCWYDTQDEARTVADRLEAERIPCDVLTLDGRAWLNLRTRCDFQFDRTRYPEPEQLIQRLTDQGLRVCLWEYPYLSVEGRLFDEAAARGYLLSDATGEPYIVRFPKDAFNEQLTAFPDSAFVDFTNPEAVRWYQELHRPLFEMGVAVFKTDFGEQVPPDAVAANGLTGSVLHNAYATLYNQAVYEATGQHTGEAVVWARSGWAGSQRQPIHWGGDPPATWSGMAATLRGGLALSLSGFSYWSHDIGGFHGPHPSPELYIRWAQFGLLSAFSRCHGTTPREPWLFGDEAQTVFLKYAQLRYRLLPYLISAARESWRIGLPMMRPMVLEAPDETAAWEADQQYLLGPDLLVAPLTVPGGRRRVYLPPGAWIDVWSHTTHPGPTEIEIEAPLDQMPIFARGESLIPLGPGAVGPHVSHVGDESLETTQLDYFPNPNEQVGEARTEVWESEPIQFEIRRDVWALTLRQTGEVARDLVLRWHLPAAIDSASVRAVLIDGGEESNWRSDGKALFIPLRLPPSNRSAHVVIDLWEPER